MLLATFKPIRKARIPTPKAIAHLAISLLLLVLPSDVVSPSTADLVAPPAPESGDALGDGLTEEDGLAEGSVEGDGLGDVVWAKVVVAMVSNKNVETTKAVADLLIFMACI
ncbi:MAG: hypothetical protein Q8P25_03330 [Candidatus Curtissbacteria bacterium]|nr:hypothetical protein [Candidatus Curtissbacteria bacterium]